MYQYSYPRPALTVDSVIFGFEAGQLSVLLIERANDPYQGAWALPGGFVDQNEDLPVAAVRELEEETGLRGIPLRQCGAFGKYGRDPRGHTVTVAYYGFVDKGTVEAIAADDAANLAWFDIHSLPEIAFDHRELVSAACRIGMEQIALGNWAQICHNVDAEAADIDKLLAAGL